MKYLYLRILDVQIQFNCWYLVHIKHAKCCICGEPAVLELKKGKYICEDCAQICGEITMDQEDD
ncbi:hypothetical protein FIU74_00815 [Lactobacillus buchneri]|nr:hypothetical protein [Lentilactobacillus buchneri]